LVWGAFLVSILLIILFFYSDLLIGSMLESLSHQHNSNVRKNNNRLNIHTFPLVAVKIESMKLIMVSHFTSRLVGAAF